MLLRSKGKTPNTVGRPKKRKAKIKKSNSGKLDADDTLENPSSSQRLNNSASRVQKRDIKDVIFSMKPKEEANVKRRKTGSHMDVPITLSDSEDDVPSRYARPRFSRSNQWSSDNVEDVKPSIEALEANILPTFNESTTDIKSGDEILSKDDNKMQVESELEDQTARANKLQEDLEAQTAATTKAQDDIEIQRTWVNDHRAEVERLKREHAIELQRVRKEEMDEKILEVEVEHRKRALETAKELLQLKDERDELKRALEAEKTRAIGSAKTRDGLQFELKTEKQKSVALDVKIKALQVEKTTLTEDLEKERKEHLESRETIAKLSLLAEEIASLQTIKDHLNKDVEALKPNTIKQAAHFPTPSTLSSSPTALSPTPSPTPSTRPSYPPTVPSLPSSSEETKIDNVRKTYIAVKMRYDTLYSIAKQLSTSTRGMPLASFGEFGGYLRQLNTAISDAEGDGQRKKDAF